jgi:hypothetical protein
MKVGRNEPCPCGSGKKYKHCCLSREERRSQSRGDGVSLAIAWLEQRHRKALGHAVADFFAFLDEHPQRSDRLAQLPDGLHGMVQMNLNEWLVAEGTIEVRGERRRIVEVVLGPGGPLFAAEVRQWIEALAAHSLRVYEVQEVVPGEGLWVKDALASKAPRVWVRERSASQGLVRWEILGARLIPVGEEWQLSGAVYPIPRPELAGLRLGLRAAARAGGRKSAPIIATWLWCLTNPPAPLPELVDAGSGEALLMVTDHYDVTDWDELAAALARQPDIEGNREKGWVWLEEAPPEQMFRRSRLGLNPGKADRLEVFARTRSRAEQGAAWLQEVAGHALGRRTRELVDPVAAFEQRAAGTARPAAPSPPIQLPQAIHQELYRHWADQPVPALGGLTPRQAVRSASGRKEVIELLKEYELSDERLTRKQGLAPASWRFLWDQLGLKYPKKRQPIRPAVE